MEFSPHKECLWGSRKRLYMLQNACRAQHGDGEPLWESPLNSGLDKKNPNPGKNHVLANSNDKKKWSVFRQKKKEKKAD